ncbi:hypothetical protein [Zobellella maritima]|uniref:hypothetical protein n=1 Tax=Zobellella maritima TaxID=2059725 RepID=UPI000E30328A|nr:hypothetical protein [Zobellella maritima]
MLMWILLLASAALLLFLFINHGRSRVDLATRLDALEADNRRLQERVTTLESLVLEKEKQRPFDELK